MKNGRKITVAIILNRNTSVLFAASKGVLGSMLNIYCSGERGREFDGKCSHIPSSHLYQK